MSKYLVFPEIVFKDRRLLIAALADLGYSVIEEGEALPLLGYQGDRRPETAELVVRRQQIGAASNDLGFARTDRGYVPIISEYGSTTSGCSTVDDSCPSSARPTASASSQRSRAASTAPHGARSRAAWSRSRFASD